MCCNINFFGKLKPLTNIHNVVVLDWRKVRIKARGNVVLANVICIKNVLYDPAFHYKLISIYKLVSDRNYDLIFKPKQYYVQGQSKKLLPLVESKKRMYYLLCSMDRITVTDFTIVARSIEEIKRWHLRLGHLRFKKMEKLLAYLDINDIENKFFCTICPLVKQSRLCFSKSQIKTSKAFKLVHVDI